MPGSKPYLTQADVQKIIAAADAYAEAHNYAVTIAVCDDGGHIMGLSRRDHCAPLSAYIAQEKARSAAMGRKESRVFEEMINGGRTAFLSSPQITGMLEGGVNIVVEGHTIGAVGVSGVKSEQDADVAKVGIAAL